MNQREFEASYEHLIGTCKSILVAGAHEYAGDEDRLANFKDCGKLLGIEPEKVAFIYFYKHVSGLAKYCRDRKEQRDSVQGRIVDAINYLILLDAVLSEHSKRSAGIYSTPVPDDVVSGKRDDEPARKSFIPRGFQEDIARRPRNISSIDGYGIPTGIND